MSLNDAADRERTRSLAAAMTAAVLFLFLLTSIPYAGAPLLLLATLFGIGAIVLALLGHAHSETLERLNRLQALTIEPKEINRARGRIQRVERRPRAS